MFINNDCVHNNIGILVKRILLNCFKRCMDFLTGIKVSFVHLLHSFIN